MIQDNYDKLRDGLQTGLEGCVDVKDAADCIGRTLDKLRMQTRTQAETPALSRETDRLFAAARQAALLMLSVTEADITAAPVKMNLTRRERLKKLLPWLSAGVSMLLTVWMELLGQHIGAIVALCGAALGVLQAYVRSDGGAPGELTARTRVNARELMRMTDRLVQALDDALEQAGLEAGTASAEQPHLTGEWYAPLQMLMEASYTGDGGYALKAVPQLETILADQGIEMRSYSDKDRSLFDMFPGTEPGLTIRPAIVRDGRLLARGQATEKMG